jgi:hypothetical protein
VGILLNFDNRTIEFFLNGQSQGIAFTNLQGSVKIAASAVNSHKIGVVTKPSMRRINLSPRNVFNSVIRKAEVLHVREASAAWFLYRSEVHRFMEVSKIPTRFEIAEFCPVLSKIDLDMQIVQYLSSLLSCCLSTSTTKLIAEDSKVYDLLKYTSNENFAPIGQLFSFRILYHLLPKCNISEIQIGSLLKDCSSRIGRSIYRTLSKKSYLNSSSSQNPVLLNHFAINQSICSFLRIVIDKRRYNAVWDNLLKELIISDQHSLKQLLTTEIPTNPSLFLLLGVLYVLGGEIQCASEGSLVSMDIEGETLFGVIVEIREINLFNSSTLKTESLDSSSNSTFVVQLYNDDEIKMTDLQNLQLISSTQPPLRQVLSFVRTHLMQLLSLFELPDKIEGTTLQLLHAVVCRQVAQIFTLMLKASSEMRSLFILPEVASRLVKVGLSFFPRFEDTSLYTPHLADLEKYCQNLMSFQLEEISRNAIENPNIENHDLESRDNESDCQISNDEDSSQSIAISLLSNSLQVRPSQLWNFGRGDYGLCPSGGGTAVVTPSPCDLHLFGGVRVLGVSGCYYHAIAITEDNRVWSWGYNGNGALGHGDTNNCIQPKLIACLLGKRIVQVSASYSSAYALSATGEVYSSGDNSQGQLGNGSAQRSTVFVPVGGPLEGQMVNRIASGGYSAMATTSNERIYLWGGNAYCQLGLGSDRSNKFLPVWNETEVLQKHQWAQICMGMYHSMALTMKGELYTWGGGLITFLHYIISFISHFIATLCQWNI